MANLDNFRLVVFRAVARQLSFRKAAEELYLTQPAVSLQIKALEEDIGVQLFDRTGSHIALTEAGKILLAHSHRQMRCFLRPSSKLAHSAETTPENWPWAPPPPSPNMCFLDCWASSARASARSPDPDQRQYRTDRRCRRKQKIELGFIEGPARSRDVKTEPFLEDEMVLIVSAAHEWAELKSIPSL